MDDEFSLGEEPMECDPDLFEIEGARLVAFKFPGMEIGLLGVPPEVRIIGARALAGCRFERIAFLGEIEAIEEEAFCDCDRLESICVPGTVKSIGSSAFYGCRSLRDVCVSQGVELIGDMAFANSGIERIDLPRSASSVSPSAFFYSDGLCEINVDAGNETYSSFDGSLYTKDLKTLVCPRRAVSNFTVADETESVGEFAFYGCAGLVRATLSPATTSIEEGAFSGCESLKAVKMPDSLRFIGDSAFNGCSSLSSLKIPASVTHIGNGAFHGCERFDSFEFEDPDGWTIDDGGRGEDVNPKAMQNLKKLRERLTGDADMERNSLEKFSCEPRPRQTFQSRDPFEEGEAEDDVFAGDDSSFVFEEDGCDPSLFEIKDGNVISFKAKDSEMDVLCIPSDVTAIGEGAFRGAKFKAVRFLGSVKSIEDDAFVACANLRQISLPDGLERLGECVFDESALEKISLPRSLTSISPAVFMGTKHLSEIAVDEDNEAYKAADGNLYTRDGKTLVCAKHTIETLDVPLGVTSIGDYAFDGCEKLSSINLPAGVEYIGKSAFFECVSLESIDIPSGVTAINSCAFECCEELRRVSIPSGVTSIGDRAFRGCALLKSVDIPAGVKAIGNSAFELCQSLESVNLPAGVKTIGEGAFWSCSVLESVKLHAGLISIGTKAFGYCDSLESIKIPSGVTSIGDEAFYGCTQLREANIPDKVTSIGEYAFAGCFYLKITENLPKSLTSIGDWAFVGCVSVHPICIPAETTYIGAGAFRGCDLCYDLSFEDPYNWTCTTKDGNVVDVDPSTLKNAKDAYIFLVCGNGIRGIKKKR